MNCFLKIAFIFYIVAFTNISKGQTNENGSTEESLLKIFETASTLQDNYKRFDKYLELNNAITSETTPFTIWVLDSNDSINKSNFRYLIHYYQNIDHPVLNGKYNLNICLTPYYSVVNVDHSYMGKYKLKEYMRLYYDECDSFLIPIPYKKEVLQYFGDIKIPEMIFSISIDAKKNKGLNNNSWDDLFFFINEVNNLFNEVREELAKERFSMSFISLSSSEQQAIKAFRPMKIQILLDYDCFDTNLPTPAPEIHTSNKLRNF